MYAACTLHDRWCPNPLYRGTRQSTYQNQPFLLGSLLRCLTDITQCSCEGRGVSVHGTKPDNHQLIISALKESPRSHSFTFSFVDTESAVGSSPANPLVVIKSDHDTYVLVGYKNFSRYLPAWAILSPMLGQLRRRGGAGDLPAT